ncbi:glycine--tRNA ligase subunit beta [Thiohalomonas denitrificans]|uniref:glycine--tRNA ligase subunit beta n=1 Tax=Thiohalomonas denitrificans TaxID=415747 RepID=UPI0026EBDEE4|nr:glycine--tRNA ligase subunit beta [Thiohalomonas denitrificans]
MTETRDLLIEIGTEELPPKALNALSRAFAAGIEEGLGKADLKPASVTRYASPRRLAVLIRDLPVGQADREVERRGPALTAAFDEQGVPTPAAQGFARSCGVEVDELETMQSKKGAWLVFRKMEPGQTTAELIPAIVQTSLDKLPIPKRMRWGNLDAEFVRPVHWVVLLFGDEVIDTEILCVRSGRETRGHRFHHGKPLYIGEPAAYAPLLETEGRVIVDLETRREAIRGQVLEAAKEVGGQAVIDEELLDEVNGLVEWPVAVIGNFEKRFLDVPAECLISAMKEHQKYFHVVDGKGRLMPHFITISNIESSSPEVVRRGNERVIRPRLTDAEFFWNQDRKTPLGDRVESLKSILFQQKLGTLHDKTARVMVLAKQIADGIGGDTEKARRAAEIAKCDLMTEMVYEFPDLQGIMGRYYAEHDGEDSEVARALDEQYMPRFAGDQLPATPTGQAVAIADRLDTLVGIFGIGQPPSGAKDPFGLRRASLGVLRTLIERELDIDLADLIETATTQLRNGGVAVADDTATQVLDFVMERLRAYYQDQGIAHDTFDAVLARRPTNPRDFDQRIRAVNAFRELPEAEALATANKRIHNILKKAEQTIPDRVDTDRLQEAEERELADAMEKAAAEVGPLFAERRYEEALKRLAALRTTVDRFFDEVMVMADDPKVRENRLALLKRLGDLFLQAADISRLQS